MESSLRPPAGAPGFRLIETGLWTPEHGLHRRARHIARLDRTAGQLDIAPRGVGQALDAIAGDGPLRVRLTVDAAGRAEVATQPHVPLPDGTIWRLVLSDDVLEADDPWLGVKTTRRALYDAARAELPNGTDEVIFANGRGELCEGTITNLFVDTGQGLLTPPLRCGLLPGILREELIATGAAREAVLRPNDLDTAGAVYVGNALRGLVPARMAAR